MKDFLCRAFVSASISAVTALVLVACLPVLFYQWLFERRTAAERHDQELRDAARLVMLKSGRL